MTDLLALGSRFLERQRRRFLSRDVRYRRGARSVIVPATVGRTVFRLDLGGGTVERVEARDYLIALADLRSLGLPLRGDQIIEETASRRHTAEVLAPGHEPHWAWADPERTVLRIHTKHLSTELIPEPT